MENIFQKKISFIVPLYNEEKNLKQFYIEIKKVIDKLKNYRFEILFINDGSKDNSLTIIKELQSADTRISYVDLSRNYGKEIAMAAGIDYVDADAIIMIDADLQHSPYLVTEMLKYYEEGYDDVYTKRKNRDDESYLKRKGSDIYYKILEIMAETPIQKDVSDFRLLSKKSIDSLKKLKETQRYTKGLFSFIGFKQKEILYTPEERFAGHSKWNYRKLFKLATEGITSSTTVPLKLATYFGFLISFISFLWIIVIIFNVLIYGKDTPGYASLLSVILFIGGLQFIFLGIIGEYISRIFWETKNRPLYFVNEFSRGLNDEKNK